MSEFNPNWDVSVEVLPELQLENQRLKNKNDALVARVARLSSCLDLLLVHGHDSECDLLNYAHHKCNCGYTQSEIVLNETPVESLAHIQAAAVENSLTWLSKNYPNACQPACGLIQQYANQLRQQGKDHD